MKGVRISMLYQYFDNKIRNLNNQIFMVENLAKQYSEPNDIIKLIELKAKKEEIDQIFHDLYNLVVDIPTNKE